METSVRFFKSGTQLMHGQGDLKTALGMLPIVAQLASSAAASLFVTDEAENVLKPLVLTNP